MSDQFQVQEDAKIANADEETLIHWKLNLITRQTANREKVKQARELINRLTKENSRIEQTRGKIELRLAKYEG